MQRTVLTFISIVGVDAWLMRDDVVGVSSTPDACNSISTAHTLRSNGGDVTQTVPLQTHSHTDRWIDRSSEQRRGQEFCNAQNVIFFYGYLLKVCM